MKTRQSTLIKLIKFLIITLTLVSCSTTLEVEIVGKWSEIGSTEKIELFKDGTIMITLNGVNVDSGKYTFVDRGRIKIELDDLGSMVKPFVSTVAISDDELTWILPDGKITKYSRGE